MKNDTYNEAILIESADAIIRIYRPILTEEEHSRRMRYIQNAATELLKSQERKNQR